MSGNLTSGDHAQASSISERDLANALPHLSPSHTTDSKKKICLLVGEDDFSFTAALLERHRFRDEPIIATEIRLREELIDMYGGDMEDRLSDLQELGVKVIFEIDGTKLHKYFQDEHIHRIYFNFPYTSARVTRNEPSDTARMLKEFFASAVQVQDIGDRILLTLVYKADIRDQEWWHGHTYGIELAAHASLYELVGKRCFSSSQKRNRYSGYTHRETNQNSSSQNSENARQYVFERVSTSSKFKSKTKTGCVNNTDVSYFKDVETNSDTDTDSEIPSSHTTSPGIILFIVLLWQYEKC